jgi:NAD(P)-dependent dehydrogenase (short-subunit alcohol dehydrogenase family)
MDDLMRNKVVLVTGGTSGIGRVTAQAFARAGCHVAITGRRAEEGKKAIEAITQDGGSAHYVRADVTKEEDCRRMVEETVKVFGRLDYAFNNAGVEGKPALIEQESLENFNKVMQVNVTGVLLSMKYEIPALRSAGGGAIVNNASIVSALGMEETSAYVASKHAVIGLTRTAALETSKDGIRVNAVSPAAIGTETWQAMAKNDPQTRAYVESQHPIGRIGTPEEVANAVLFLCSPAASFITGTNLFIDGGYTLR